MYFSQQNFKLEFCKFWTLEIQTLKFALYINSASRNAILKGIKIASKRKWKALLEAYYIFGQKLFPNCGNSNPPMCIF